jgi:hypothetical protein
MRSVSSPQIHRSLARRGPKRCRHFGYPDAWRSFGCYRGMGSIVQANASKAATVLLSLLLIASASLQAHASPPAAPQESSPLSGVAHDFANWLRGFPYAGMRQHRRTASSVPLPLPRPRPAFSASPALSNASASAPKKALVLIND